MRKTITDCSIKAGLVLWIYGATVDSSQTSNSQNLRMTSDDVFASMICLDRPLDNLAEQLWVRDGHTMQPYLTGVGYILGPDGVSRVIRECSRCLCASSAWPNCAVMGKSLEIFYMYRSQQSA